jgi:uracil-DNA glycosylase
MGTEKIIIIGQAPPAVKQTLPYDTTMLYDWLDSIGIPKCDAYAYFDFDAVYNEFPGFNEEGGHRVPTYKQCESYWSELSKKIKSSSKVIIVGAAAYNMLEMLTRDTFLGKGVVCTKGRILEKDFLYLPHPSKRNTSLVKKLGSKLTNSLKDFVFPCATHNTI